MKQNTTELVFILDKSGSMCGLEEDTIGGFNSMLKKQQELSEECRITTVLFNQTSVLLHDRIEIQAVNPISEQEYEVGGSTALLDAIGQAIDKIVLVQKNTAKEYRSEKVLFVIITDGAENASQKYSAQKVKSMIKHQQEKYHWEFIFLGANIDAVETADNIGIKREFVSNYVHDGEGTRKNFKVLNSVMSCFRLSSKDCYSKAMRLSLDEIRKDYDTRK